MKTCAKCTNTEVVFVIIKKNNTYLHVQRLCLHHTLHLIERMNRLFPKLDYTAKIRHCQETQ